VEIKPNQGNNRRSHPFLLKIKGVAATFTMSYEQIGELKDALEEFLEVAVAPADPINPLGKKRRRHERNTGNL